ncbi:MAG: hypothetical protein F6J95_030305 [Leptolyngbya sp. SIO1E4]|nr:hypothetical protein [Leptolyngbya sp. SIO1E4]
MPIFLELLIPIFAFMLGDIFNRWQNRGKPLLIVQGFSTFIDEGTKVSYSTELREDIEASWIFSRPSKGAGEEVQLVTLYEVYTEAKDSQKELEKSAEKIDRWILDLEEIINNTDENSDVSLMQSHEKTKNIIREIYDTNGMSSALDKALTYGELKIDVEKLPNKLPKKMSDVPNNLSVTDDVRISGESQGLAYAFFQIDWHKSFSFIGRNLTSFPSIKERLEPLAIILKSADPANLREVIKEVQPIIEREARLFKHIHEYIKPILDNNKRWAAKIRLENYGSSPVIIGEHAHLLIAKKSNSLAEATVECELLPEDGKGKIRGKYILGASEKVVLWVATRKAQGENGVENDQIRNTLLAYFNNEKIEETGIVRLSTEVIGSFPIKNFLLMNYSKNVFMHSDPISFHGSLGYPNNCVYGDIRYEE